MEKTREVTWSLCFAIFAATIGSSFVFGFNISVINAPAEIIKTWIKNESYPRVHGSEADDGIIIEIWAWTAAIFSLGGCVGGLLCGYAADKFGRKGAMLANNAITLVAVMLMGISKSTNIYLLLLIGRLIIGISSGMGSCIPAMYLTEIAPLRLRGILGSTNTLVVVSAMFISQVMGIRQFLGTERLWPLLLAFPALPAFIQLITLPFCPESPKYLLLIKGKRDEAQAALMHLRKREDVSKEINEMLDEKEKPSDNLSESGINVTRNRSCWWGLIICLINHIAQQSTGMGSVLNFSTTIFREQAQMDHDQAVGATLGIGAIFVIAAIISTATIDRLGRRLLMLSGLLGDGICNIFIFVALHLLAVDSEKYHWAAYVAIIFVYIFVFLFSLGPSSIPWFYMSEITEPSKRAIVNTFGTPSNWLGGFVVSYTFLPLKEIFNEYVFLLYSALVTIGFVFLYLFAPESKGKECNEIQKEMEMRKPKCLRNL